MVTPRFDGPTYPCPRCGNVVSGGTALRAEHLPHVGWMPCRVPTYVS